MDGERVGLHERPLVHQDVEPLAGRELSAVVLLGGGVWVARRLRELLGLPDEIGLIDVSFYRDDFGERGLYPLVSLP